MEGRSLGPTRAASCLPPGKPKMPSVRGFISPSPTRAQGSLLLVPWARVLLASIYIALCCCSLPQILTCSHGQQRCSHGRHEVCMAEGAWWLYTDCSSVGWYCCEHAEVQCLPYPCEE